MNHLRVPIGVIRSIPLNNPYFPRIKLVILMGSPLILLQTECPYPLIPYLCPYWTGLNVYVVPLRELESRGPWVRTPERATCSLVFFRI